MKTIITTSLPDSKKSKRPKSRTDQPDLVAHEIKSWKVVHYSAHISSENSPFVTSKHSNNISTTKLEDYLLKPKSKPSTDWLWTKLKSHNVSYQSSTLNANTISHFKAKDILTQSYKFPNWKPLKSK